MTFAEFESWIEEHYGELLAVAKTLTNHDPEDVVQAAIARMWDSPDLDLRIKYPCTSEDERAGFLAVWPWAKGVVRSEASTQRRTLRRSGTNHLPAHLRGEEGVRGADTKTEPRSKLKRLAPEKDAERYADTYYRKRLEEDRRDFDMDGYGRQKNDPSFEVNL